MKVLADEYHTLLHRKTMQQVKQRAETADSLVSGAHITFESQSRNYQGNGDNYILF
jgi:hypothetical protein